MKTENRPTAVTAQHFSQSIMEAFGDKAGCVYFSVTKTRYYAAYKPEYPDATNGDFVVSYNHSTGEIAITADTAAVPIIRKYKSLNGLIEAIKSMDR